MRSGIGIAGYPPDVLRGKTPHQLFAGRLSPAGMVAGLWLYHGDLDAAHRVSQELETPEGSFWHAVMHRREPDPGNAAYWFRRTGRHPVFPALRQRVAGLVVGHEETEFVLKAEWDPFGWIDFWEKARRRPESPDHSLALQIQEAEWEILFEYCARPTE